MSNKAKSPITRKRFPTSSDGFLRTSEGNEINFVVCDVSHGGLKLKVDDPLNAGQAYALILSMGIKDRSEVIGKCIWVDENNGYAGFEIRSSDKIWNEIIDFLESNALKMTG